MFKNYVQDNYTKKIIKLHHFMTTSLLHFAAELITFTCALSSERKKYRISSGG